MNRTITAAHVPGHHACKKCGAGLPRDRIWGINEAGITTAEARAVAYWLCSNCFSEPVRVSDPKTPSSAPTGTQCEDCHAAPGYVYSHTPKGTTNTTLFRLCPACFMKRYPHLCTEKKT